MMMKSLRYLTFLSLKILSPGSNHPIARLPTIPPQPFLSLPPLLPLPLLTPLLNLLLLPNRCLFPIQPRFVPTK